MNKLFNLDESFSKKRCNYSIQIFQTIVNVKNLPSPPLQGFFSVGNTPGIFSISTVGVYTQNHTVTVLQGHFGLWMLCLKASLDVRCVIHPLEVGQPTSCQVFSEFHP